MCSKIQRVIFENNMKFCKGCSWSDALFPRLYPEEMTIKGLFVLYSWSTPRESIERVSTRGTKEKICLWGARYKWVCWVNWRDEKGDWKCIHI